MASFKILACLLVLAVVSASHFTNFRLVRITPKTKAQIDLIEPWTQNPDFDVWNEKPNHIDVLLSPQAFDSYTKVMDAVEIEYSIINNNIQDTMDEETRSIQKQKLEKLLRADTSVVGTFGSMAKVYAFMDSLAGENDWISTYSAGQTAQGRDLKVIKFKKPTAVKAIWIDCGIHAREWISPATCVWIINSLVNEHNTDATVKKLLDYYEIHILPLHNPDGYEYSQSSSANRLWRKNRKTNAGSTCIGVDLNRNFGYYWMVAGASNNPCSETYAGPVQNSELETLAVEGVIQDAKNKGRWDAFFTIHTYGQYWFTPWGYTSALPSDYTELASKSTIGANAIKAVYGSAFKVGSSTNLLYAAAGGSDDWAKGVAGIKYSHCLELRPSDTGVDANYGFQLPVDRVPKAGLETYKGIIAFLDAIYKVQP